MIDPSTELPSDERVRVGIALDAALEAQLRTANRDVEIRIDDRVNIGRRVHELSITIRLSRPC